jgi:hypothetical protein
LYDGKTSRAEGKSETRRGNSVYGSISSTESLVCGYGNPLSYVFVILLCFIIVCSGNGQMLENDSLGVGVFVRKEIKQQNMD